MATGATAGRRTGKTKWFDVKKGYGFITPDDGGTDVFAHQTVIQMTGFRSLGENEEVEFVSKNSDKGEGMVEAVLVCAIGGSDCKGSERHPMSRRKFKRIRCYNCGRSGNHKAKGCPEGPMKKACYNCKLEDHLIADCPQKQSSQEQDSSGITDVKTETDSPKT